jgi:hypothetical protein
LHAARQVALDQLLAELDELLAVDGGFLVGEDEEADAFLVHQFLDLVDDLDRIAHAVVAPEFPLRAERAGEGAAARHVGDRHLPAKRHVDVLVPFQQRPVGVDRVEVLDRGRGLRGLDRVAILEGEALDLSVLVRSTRRRAMAFITSTMISSPSPRTIRSTLSHSEKTCLYMKVGWMPPRTRDGVRHDLLGDLQRLLGHVDRGRDGGRAHNIGLHLGQFHPS